MDNKVILFPGQGSQQIGMGKDYFPRYQKEMDAAYDILGYSVEELCLQGPKSKLDSTLYTQPCLFVVNALHYFDFINNNHDDLHIVSYAGLSLGEYNALHASGMISFEDGLRLVQKRASLMANIRNGAMAAVVGIEKSQLQSCLEKHSIHGIDIANENSHKQNVIAGQQEDILKAKDVLEGSAGASVVVLPVSGAFHSRYMEPAKPELVESLKTIKFATPTAPVISNVTAQPYKPDEVVDLLAAQLSSTVRWLDTMVNISRAHPDAEVLELGPGNTLTALARSIARELKKRKRTDCTMQAPHSSKREPNKTGIATKRISLGANSFRQRYRLKAAYVAGGMARGISSVDMVAKMAHSGYLSFYGASGLPTSRVESDLNTLANLRRENYCFGVSLLAKDFRKDVIDLLIQHQIKLVEASNFIEASKEMVRYKAAGLSESNGNINIENRLFIKVSRVDIAKAFLTPASDSVINDLYSNGEITSEQARLIRQVPIADEICMNSGTEHNIGESISFIKRVRDDMLERYQYPQSIHIGVAGGIGSGFSAAIAFLVGADFILTGSINQCSVEANTSDQVKNMLSKADIHDMEYAPDADRFELGVQNSVLKKGVFFPMRARKLLELYNCFDEWNEIPEKSRAQIEANYFRRSFSHILDEEKAKMSDVDRAFTENHPKYQMAVVFKWYCDIGNQFAIDGDESRKVDYQVYTSPAIGIFNRNVIGTALEDWKNREVVQIAETIMHQASERYQELKQV